MTGLPVLYASLHGLLTRARPHRARYIHAPGHTPGSIALLHQPSKLLLAGDAVMPRKTWLGGAPTLAVAGTGIAADPAAELASAKRLLLQVCAESKLPCVLGGASRIIVHCICLHCRKTILSSSPRTALAPSAHSTSRRRLRLRRHGQRRRCPRCLSLLKIYRLMLRPRIGTFCSIFYLKSW